MKQTPNSAARKFATLKSNLKMQKTTQFDEAVLKLIRGSSFYESIRRLYISGDIDGDDLVRCVERGLISLADYNDILESL